MSWLFWYVYVQPFDVNFMVIGGYGTVGPISIMFKPGCKILCDF